MQQYFRNWRLQIIPYTVNSDGSYNYETARVIPELKVVFDIKDTALGDPLTASLQIYNLSPDSKSALNTGLCSIILEVCYGLDDSKLKPVLTGEVTNSYELRVGADLIQNIWVRDSGKSIDDYTIVKPSYENPVSVKQILTDILNATPNINTFPDYLGTSQAIIELAEEEDDWLFGSSMRNQLNALLSPLDLLWYVSGGVVRIINKNDGSVQGTGDLTPFNVSIETGLLSRPKVDWVGIEFEHLMNPAFQPGNLITIDPQTVQADFGNELYVPIPGEKLKLSGQFRVMEAQHKGDTRGANWKTLVKAFHKVG